MDHHVVEHIGHCLDSLRQDIMCAADDTLMPGLVQGELGNNQCVKEIIIVITLIRISLI
jgi:hypothetical protein